MGMEDFFDSIVAIQSKIKDYIKDEDEVLEFNSAKNMFIKKKSCEYLGLKIPKDRLCINSKGRVCMAKPECPRCGSMDVSQNGSKKRRPETITGTEVDLCIQKYICNDCESTFDTPLEHLVKRYARVTNDITALSVMLYVDCQLSGGEVAGIIKRLFGVEKSPDTVRRWSEIIGKSVGEYKSDSMPTGIYHYDEQRVTLNGCENWRYVILDTNGTVLRDEIRDNKNQESIKDFVVETLKDKKVETVVTDDDNKYPAVIEELRSEVASTQNIPLNDVKIVHQLCQFHLFQGINMTLKKAAGFNPFARKKLPPELDALRKDLIAVFYHKTKKGAREAFEKVMEKRWNYKASVRKLIENIDKDFENLTHCLREKADSPEPRIPRTNNLLEQYFRTTHPETVKKKYKSKEKLNAYLKGIALNHTMPANKHWLEVIGLCLSIFSTLGMLAQLM